MLDILNDLSRNRKIGATDTGLRIAERAGDRVDDLEERLDKMALLNLALWSLLQEKLGLTEDELSARVVELDLRDGKLDGRIQGAPVDCPDCARPVHQRHRRCLYCGFELPKSGFESVAR